MEGEFLRILAADDVQGFDLAHQDFFQRCLEITPTVTPSATGTANSDPSKMKIVDNILVFLPLILDSLFAVSNLPQPQELSLEQENSQHEVDGIIRGILEADMTWEISFGVCLNRPCNNS